MDIFSQYFDNSKLTRYLLTKLLSLRTSYLEKEVILLTNN